MDTVYIVQNNMLGWDSVVGVFKQIDKKILEERFPVDEGYIVQDFYVYSSLDEWE